MRPTIPTSRSRFNPRPASSARRTSYLSSHGSRVTVSTHAPLRQRGERPGRPIPREWIRVSTHAPLRQRGERWCATAHHPPKQFQPTPRFVSEANHRLSFQRPLLPAVSTHAPLRQRGEPVAAEEDPQVLGFQPTPRFVSEANHASSSCSGCSASFNPRPASSARRTQDGSCHRTHSPVSTHAPLRQRGEPCGDDAEIAAVLVSTHAPLRQRGEPSRTRTDSVPTSFQPTPRFVSEANLHPCRLRSVRWRFNPRPASSARRTTGG